MVKVIVLLTNYAYQITTVDCVKDYKKILGGDMAPLRSKWDTPRCYVNVDGRLDRLADNPWCTFLKSNFISRGITSVHGPVIICSSSSSSGDADGKEQDGDINDLIVEKVKAYHAEYFDGLEDLSPDSDDDDDSESESYRSSQSESSDDEEEDIEAEPESDDEKSSGGGTEPSSESIDDGDDRDYIVNDDVDNEKLVAHVVKTRKIRRVEASM